MIRRLLRKLGGVAGFVRRAIDNCRVILNRRAISLLRWWPLWGSVVVALVAYILAITTVATDDQGGFHSNILAGVIGISIGFALAWFFIDRHIQN